MSASIALPRRVELPSRAVAGLVKVLHAVLTCPEYFFLAALTAMLFCPPDLKTFPVDRLAFALLVCVFAVRLLLRRGHLRIHSSSYPMFGLLLFGLISVLNQPYDAQAWSVFAAKWVVPFVLFHLAGAVFAEERDRRKLETFSLAVLCYLSVTAVLFLVGATGSIFPRFILNEGIGIHSDRARGPFLQAVANGVCLNVLAIVALHSFERRRLRGILAAFLFVSTPLALLATKTRAVWLSAGISVAAIAVFSKGRARVVALCLGLTATVVVCTTVAFQRNWDEWKQRLGDSSPLEFRLEMYRAGWQMFSEKPLLGWGGNGVVQPEIERRISGFRTEFYIFHNTYLELAVERGLLGLGLYAWLMISLFRLAPRGLHQNPSQFLGRGFGTMWAILLCAYLVNASAVVMNYQFVNGYVFTIAGVLSVQQARSSAPAREIGRTSK